MTNHKHYIFAYLDNMAREDIPKKRDTLEKLLRSVMHYYIAEHKLHSSMTGDEADYIEMLTDEYVV